MYHFYCQDIAIEGHLLQFAAESFPLEQNCDFLEIDSRQTHSQLRLFYDDGTQLAIYRPAFDKLFIDSHAQTISIWLSAVQLDADCHKCAFSTLQLHLGNRQILQRLGAVLAFDRMICPEQIIPT